MSVTIFHNPKCSKSRATLALLEDHGITPSIREYLTNPPSEAELGELLSLLGLSAREFIRKGEAAYTESGCDEPNRSESELISAMHNNPSLIERPIVVANGKAAIGRPPENVLGIL